MAISLADPDGPIEAAKESMAAMKSATNPPSRQQLLTEVAMDLQGMVQQRHNPLQGFRPTAGSDVWAQVLDELRAGVLGPRGCRFDEFPLLLVLGDTPVLAPITTSAVPPSRIGVGLVEPPAPVAATQVRRGRSPQELGEPIRDTGV